MKTEDRFVIPAPASSFFFPLLLVGLGGAAVYYGFKTTSLISNSPEYAVLIPIGLFLFLGSFLLYRSASRPLILDKKVDRIIGYSQELSKASKVVVTEINGSDDKSYVVELVFPERNFRLARAGWSYSNLAHDADSLAKKIGAFLGIPVETRIPFYASFSFEKGLHLTEEQARDAEKAGVKVDPEAIK